MRSLIRFEDTYGMADVFCCMYGCNFLEAVHGRQIVELSDEVFVQSALGNIGCFIFDENADSLVKERGIERIIIVFDLDDPSGNKRKVLSIDEAKKKLEYGVEFFKKTGYSVDVIGVPVAYAAETILLYQYLSSNSLNLEVESLIHCDDTNHFHLLLLTALCNYKNYREAKVVRNFIDKERLVDKIQKSLAGNDRNVNKDLLEWICHNCSMNDFNFDRQLTLKLLQRAAELFYSNLGDKKVFTLTGKNGTVLLDTNTSLRELEKLARVGI